MGHEEEARDEAQTGYRDPDNTCPGLTFDDRETGAGDEDSVAAMLLSLQDDGEGGTGLGGEVPEGSTVMDLAVPPVEGQEGEKKEEKKDPSKASSSNAAKALLEKYMRRPR